MAKKLLERRLGSEDYERAELMSTSYTNQTKKISFLLPLLDFSEPLQYDFRRHKSHVFDELCSTIACAQGRRLLPSSSAATTATVFSIHMTFLWINFIKALFQSQGSASKYHCESYLINRLSHS
jgi:hypothetical protein